MQILFSRLTGHLVSITAVALCAIGLCLLGADESNAAGRYVAFGDSGTTGSGLSNTSYPGSRKLCYQTQYSYPVFVASALGVSDFTSAACSLARINDLTTTQALYNSSTMQFEDTAPPQFDALNGTETLITISIGDNDSGYGDIVKDCFGNTSSSTPCKDKWGANHFSEQARTFMSSPLGDAIDEARRRSPVAEIWVIGYPRLLRNRRISHLSRVDQHLCWRRPTRQRLAARRE